jgi:hypothetical protein
MVSRTPQKLQFLVTLKTLKTQNSKYLNLQDFWPLAINILPYYETSLHHP